MLWPLPSSISSLGDLKNWFWLSNISLWWLILIHCFIQALTWSSLLTNLLSLRLVRPVGARLILRGLCLQWEPAPPSSNPGSHGSTTEPPRYPSTVNYEINAKLTHLKCLLKHTKWTISVLCLTTVRAPVLDTNLELEPCSAVLCDARTETVLRGTSPRAELAL